MNIDADIRQQMRQGIKDNMCNQCYFGGQRRDALGIETANNRCKDRHGIEAEAILQEVIQAARCIDDKRSNDNRNNSKAGTEIFSDLDQMCIVAGLVDQRTVEIQRIQGDAAIERRVKRGQDSETSIG